MSLLTVKNVKKIYTTRFGSVKVQALNDVNFFRGGRGVCGNHGGVRLGKDHALKHSGFSGHGNQRSSAA